MTIPFAPPFINEDVIREVTDTLNSGWITTGPRVKLLESMMNDYTQMSHCVCINSWTSGALLVLKWWGLQPGDEVIIPAYTYAATALAVMHAGGTPVMIDVKEDFSIDPDLLRNAITVKTKAIIPVDFAGWPCDYETIQEITAADSTRALFTPSNEVQATLGRPLVLADAAHSLGATYRQLPAGLQADIAVYSLHAVKNVTTAEGGVIGLNLPAPFDNKNVYDWMKLNSLNGQTKDALAKIQGGHWRYDIVSDGLKINMPDVCAAIGIAQLKQYADQLLPRRKALAGRYAAGLATKSWARLPCLAHSLKESSCHIYPLRIEGITEQQRDQIIELLSKNGIAVNVHFLPLPMLSLFREMGYKIDHYPVSYKNYHCEISLPVYPQMTDDMIDYIIAALEKAYITVTA
jgi:dTDP-4-amino-4,6-dideoxygalactose transaminase